MVPGEVPVMEGESKGDSPELRVGDLAITLNPYAGSSGTVDGKLGKDVIVQIEEMPTDAIKCYRVRVFLKDYGVRWWVAEQWLKLWWRPE